MILLRREQVSFAGGQNDQAAPEEYDPRELSLLTNARVAFDGNTAHRRGGSKRLHSSALASGAQCYGMVEFNPSGSSRQLVAAFGTAMYASSDGGATWSSIATGLSAAYWDFASMDVGGTRTLYAVNGGSLYQYDGTTWSAVSGSSVPSGATFCEVFNRRLWVAGHNEDRAQGSKVADPTNWTTAGGALSVQIATHEGSENLTGLYQLGPVLLVFKRRSIGYIEGYGFQTLQVEAGARGSTRSVGCLGHRTIKAVGEDAIMWLSERGFELYRAGSTEIQLASQRMQTFVDGLDLKACADTPGLATACYWPALYEYWCAVPASGSTQNDRIYVYRPPVGGRAPAGWSFEPSWDVAALEAADTSDQVQHPHGAGYDGFVRQMETGDKDDVSSGGAGGDDVTMTLRSRPFIFDELHRRKRARILRVGVENRGSVPVTVEIDILADGDDGSPQGLFIEPSSGALTRKGRFSRRGQELVAEITTTGDVRVDGLELAAEPLREAW